MATHWIGVHDSRSLLNVLTERQTAGCVYLNEPESSVKKCVKRGGGGGGGGDRGQYALGHPKQSRCLTFLCFECPKAELALQLGEMFYHVIVTGKF